jgi:hypothetical protein
MLALSVPGGVQQWAPLPRVPNLPLPGLPLGSHDDMTACRHTAVIQSAKVQVLLVHRFRAGLRSTNQRVSRHRCDKTGALLRQNGLSFATKRVERCDKMGASGSNATKRVPRPGCDKTGARAFGKPRARGSYGRDRGLPAVSSISVSGNPDVEAGGHCDKMGVWKTRHESSACRNVAE